MGFRTVVVSSRCKLECRLNYLIIRGEEEKRIFLNEINTLIIQSTAVSLTAALLCELQKNTIKVIFCDERCNPQGELLPYYGAHNTSKRYKKQIAWNRQTQDALWAVLIRRKIQNQARVLLSFGFIEEGNLLLSYAEQVEDGDVTNREGHAAKVYFHCVLPTGTYRNGGGFVNGCLNYGYAVLLSALNREIVASGYLTQLGIWHDNEFNSFNLSSDLIEPLRTIVDETAFSLVDGDELFKKKMANIMNFATESDGKKTTFDIAVRQYVRSVLAALEANDVDLVSFPEKTMIQNEL